MTPKPIDPIDPVCLIHGKKRSEHICIYCCLCFNSLEPEECSYEPDGTRVNVCIPCAQGELKQMTHYAKLWAMGQKPEKSEKSEKPAECVDPDCHRRNVTGGYCICGARHYGMWINGYQGYADAWNGNPPNPWIPSTGEEPNITNY